MRRNCRPANILFWTDAGRAGTEALMESSPSNVTDLTATPRREIRKSHKLDNVCYDIRGPVLKEADRMEEEGHRILKLNIGNPAPFGFEAPEEILVDVIRNLPTAQGYCDSKGLYPARKAIMQYCQSLQIANVEINDIYIGNGVSELVVMALQALINNGDEVPVDSGASVLRGPPRRRSTRRKPTPRPR